MAAELYPLAGELRALHDKRAVLAEALADMADTHRRAAAQLVMLESDIKAAKDARARGDEAALDRHLANAEQRAFRARVGRQSAEAAARTGLSLVDIIGRVLRRVGL